MTVMTLIVAIAVAVIALLQWLTARQKVVLDLFDKRFDVYDELRTAVARHIQGGIDMRDLAKFTRAASRAQFLFGSEVVSYLEERRIDLARAMHEATHDRSQLTEAQRKAAEEEMVGRLDRLSDFFKDLDVLVSPYMKHTQKTISLPYLDA